MAVMPKYYKIHIDGPIVELEPIYEELVPVEHGRWILRAVNSTGLIFQCSACCKFINPNKKDIDLGRTKEQPDYCPNCGADMRGDGNG